MATRRQAREWAVQILFQIDLNPSDVETVLSGFWGRGRVEDEARRYAERLVRGVWSHREEIDARLARYAEHWTLHRMAVVDRNVLRMALYELLYCPEVPPAVVINEAVDIAKYFSSSESGRFVNGILDRARKDLERAARPGAVSPSTSAS